MSNREQAFEPETIRSRLSSLGESPRVQFQRVAGTTPEGLDPAAVLIPLTEIDGRIHSVFTKRPETLPEHSGEVSYPGGRREEDDDSLLETALRETAEEIALAPEDVHVYGNLVRMPTITGYDVTVFVGEFEQPYELEPDPREIEELFTAPLDELAEPQRHRIEQRSWRDDTFDLHFFDYDDHVIWGATGYMLYRLLQLCLNDRGVDDG